MFFIWLSEKQKKKNALRIFFLWIRDSCIWPMNNLHFVCNIIIIIIDTNIEQSSFARSNVVRSESSVNFNTDEWNG